MTEREWVEYFERERAIWTQRNSELSREVRRLENLSDERGRRIEELTRQTWELGTRATEAEEKLHDLTNPLAAK